MKLTTSLLSLTTILACSWLTSSTAVAQAPVKVRGEVQNGTGGGSGCFWCTGAPFVIKFAGTTLQSTAVNLGAFLGQQVQLDGTWNGSVVTVTGMQAALETFSLGGNGSIGGTLRYTTKAAPGTLVLNLAGLGTSFFVPLGDTAILLDPAQAVPLASGLTDGNGEFRTDGTIPNNPALIGVRVFGQGIIVPASGPLFSTNIDFKQVQ